MILFAWMGRRIHNRPYFFFLAFIASQDKIERLGEEMSEKKGEIEL